MPLTSERIDEPKPNAVTIEELCDIQSKVFELITIVMLGDKGKDQEQKVELAGSILDSLGPLRLYEILRLAKLGLEVEQSR